MTHRWISTAALILSALTSLPLEAKNDKKHRRAPGREIANEYIVALEVADAATAEEIFALAGDVAAAYELTVDEVWAHAGAAFFTRMSSEHADTVSSDARVKFVETNVEWELSSVIATAVDPKTCDPTVGNCVPVLDNRLWHLDRIDGNTPLPSLSQSYCTTGADQTVYVVDTGVDKNHQEFGPDGARVLKGFNATLDGMDADDPCVGFAAAPGEHLEGKSNYILELTRASHGTAVASLVGGRRIGVAKNVTIIPIKVARCDRYAARLRLASSFYAQNETMFTAVGPRYYRALNSGTTGASEPASWPTATGSTVWDGGVQWQFLPGGVPTFSTEYLIRGLNWILDPKNTIGPKHHAVVTLSTYFPASISGVVGPTGTVEEAIKKLLAANMTVIASANNQNGNACDTSPGLMSANNPNTSRANNVITVGGTMLLNRPWSVQVNTDSTQRIFEADGIRTNTALGPYGPEPAYAPTEPVREARWVCGAGDSAICWNDTATSTLDPGSVTAYQGYNAGSNAGACVTLFAPAKNIVVAGLAGPDDYRDPRLRGIAHVTSASARGNASGTSWSAPIVAGIAARILEANSTFSPAQVRAKLLENSVASLDPATLNSHDHQGFEIPGTPNAVVRDGDVNITAQPQSTPAAASGSTTLSVVAASLTASAFTYQWYEVDSGFDFATYMDHVTVTSVPEAVAAAFDGAPGLGTTTAIWLSAVLQPFETLTQYAFVLAAAGA